jgi:uncharacterized membrane protein
MIVVDAFAVLLVLAVAGIAVFSSKEDKAKRVEAERLRNEMGIALYSGDKTKLQNFLVLWNDKLNKDQKEAIQARINDMIVEENP